MSNIENTPQERETEEEASNTGSATADPSDTQAAEGDPPIIITGDGDSENPA